MGYKLFIDESGDQGINKIRTSSAGGSSPYLTLGAVLIDDEEQNLLEEKLLEISEAIQGNKPNPQIHFSEMRHLQRVWVCKQFSELPIKCFGLISKKETLGNYANTIDHDSIRFYNKNVQYLLELVAGCFAAENVAVDNHQIIFEEIANFPYSQMRNFIATVRNNPYHSTACLLEYINPDAIMSQKKDEQPLLALADCVAYSLHKSVQDWKGVYEPRYLVELRRRIHCDSEKVIKRNGIKFIHSISQCCPAEQTEFFENLRAE